MSSAEHTVLVTGVGGNVGQGILRNLRRVYGRDLRIVGLDSGAFTAGHIFCDGFEQVPPYFDDTYLEVLAGLCRKWRVDLLIPSTDGEMASIAAASGDFPPYVGPGAKAARTFLDKHETAIAFAEHGIPFASSLLPSAYDDRWASVVVKPREGRGSRDVHFLTGAITGFDDTFLVQERIRGTEITSAFYATRSGRRLGPITFSRRLQYGMTIECSVVFDHDEEVGRIADAMIRAFGLAGPCNIQSIVEESSGRVIPFEINGRYSGTNSIRPHFGFDDVRYGVDEYLFSKEPAEPAITKGTAIRMMMDVVYPGRGPEEIQPGGEGGHIA